MRAASRKLDAARWFLKMSATWDNGQDASWRFHVLSSQQPVWYLQQRIMPVHPPSIACSSPSDPIPSLGKELVPPKLPPHYPQPQSKLSFLTAFFAYLISPKVILQSQTQTPISSRLVYSR